MLQVCTFFLRPLLLSGLLFLAGQASLAQEVFTIRDASRTFDLIVRVERCDEEEGRADSNLCRGAARVSIQRKGETSPFQVLNLPSIDIYRDTVAYNPQLAGRPRELYGDEPSFVFEDFNFDGREDLAICNGRNGGYGSPSYNVYLYNSHSHRFVENRRFSRLTEGVYLGLFLVDPRNRRITTVSKSGCCYHETENYRVINNRPVLVEQIIDDATGGNGMTVITTRRRINGRWISRVRREPIREGNQ
jgi:hypothetical protein